MLDIFDNNGEIISLNGKVILIRGIEYSQGIPLIVGLWKFQGEPRNFSLSPEAIAHVKDGTWTIHDPHNILHKSY
jgi:hypothetical protein